jgi:hypothetical protein
MISVYRPTPILIFFLVFSFTTCEKPWEAKRKAAKRTIKKCEGFMNNDLIRTNINVFSG